MPATTWNEADTAQALKIWAEYQRQNDLSSRDGQTAGIDPVSGRIWFGESASDIWQQMEADNVDTPLYYVRVGSEFYLRKGGHR